MNSRATLHQIGRNEHLWTDSVPLLGFFAGSYVKTDVEYECELH